MQLDGDIIPVLLSDGEGSPLWPFSREPFSKAVAFHFGREDAVATDGAACRGPVAVWRTDRSRKCRASLYHRRAAAPDRDFAGNDRARAIRTSSRPFDGDRRGACRAVESGRHPSCDAGRPLGPRSCGAPGPRSSTAWRPGAMDGWCVPAVGLLPDRRKRITVNPGSKLSRRTQGRRQRSSGCHT